MTKNNDELSGEVLKSYIEKIEGLEEEKADIAAMIREVFAEAKNAGFEPKVMRQVLRLRKLEGHERDEEEILLDLYKKALGME